MNRKILVFFVVLLFAVGVVCAENNTTEDVKIEDDTDYILPVSITNNGIEFSDGFTGFCLDLSKSVSDSDRFVLGSFSDDEMENNIKLAIIECYKQGKEDAMGDIISHIEDEDSNNDVLKEVFASKEKIGDKAVVNISDDSEATFDFEFLKSADDAGPNCVAYKVSVKSVETPDKLTASDDDSQDKLNQTDDSGESHAIAGGDKKTDDTDKVAASGNDKKTDDQDDAVAAGADDDKTVKTDNGKNDTKTSTENENPKENNDSSTTETNRTITNKTNTVIVNENNTTIINKNNVKTVNETAPQNDTVSTVMQTAGNPIFLLIIVIAVAAVAVIYMRRKD